MRRALNLSTLSVLVPQQMVINTFILFPIIGNNIKSTHQHNIESLKNNRDLTRLITYFDKTQIE